MSERKHEFVKLETRLLNDPRFFELEDIDQLTYLKLMILAKVLDNKIPNSKNTLKALLRDKRGENDIALTLANIKSRFPKLKSNKHFHYFVGFRQRHRMGIVQDPQSKSKSKIREEEDKSKNKRLLSLFQSLHKDQTSENYPTFYAKDKELFYELMAIYDEETITQLMNEFFITAKNPDEWWADKLSVGVFVSVIPQLIGRLRKK